MPAKEEILLTVPRNDREELRFYISHYKGKPYICLRVFWKTPDGEMAPGKQGLNLRPDEMRGLERGVVRLKKWVEANASEPAKREKVRA